MNNLKGGTFMKSALLMACGLYLSAVFLNGCGTGWDADAARGEARSKGAPGARGDSSSCTEWGGLWRTYEMPEGLETRMCGDEPCEGEDYAGVIKLACKDGELTGTKQLVSATYPQPGTKVERQLEIRREGDGFIIRHADLVPCTVTYKVHLRDAKISGEYSAENCDDITWRSKSGRFLAVRSTTARGADEP